MASNVQICNLALIRLGEMSISNIDAPYTNDKERKLAAIFSHWRDVEQASYPWAFCRKRVELAQTSSTPTFGWSYTYQLPSDYSSNPITSDGSPFQIEGDKLLSDQSSLFLGYTAKITDPSLFSPEFTELLVCRLALELSYSLTDSATLTASMLELYKKAEIRARNVASLSRGTNPINESLTSDLTWVQAGK